MEILYSLSGAAFVLLGILVGYTLSRAQAKQEKERDEREFR